MYKVIAFLRVSTTQQTIDSQRDEVYAAIHRHGYSDDEIMFISQTESAIKLKAEERISLQRMYTAIRENSSIEYVFVYEISRLTRQAKMMYEIRDFLIEHKVNLYCLKPEFTLLDKDYKMSQTASILFSLFTSLSESEMMLKKERMARGREYKKSLGKHAGGPVPIGYTTDKEDNYIIDETGAAIVRRIFEDYANGWSVRKLARQLQNEGWRTKTAFLTICQSILDIMDREIYCGDKSHPAIITRELFDAVQEQRKSKRKHITGTPNEALLKGIIRDKESGYIMSSNTANGQYYSKRYGHCTINIKAAEMVVWGTVCEWWQQIFVIKRDEYVKDVKKQIMKCDKIITTMKNKLTDNQDKIDRISERYIEGKLSKQKADELEEKAFYEIQFYRKTLNDAMADKKHLENQLNKTNDAIEPSSMKRTQQIALVNEIVKSIYVKRLTRFVCQMEIENRYTGELRIVDVNTRKCEIVGMKVITQQALPPA